MTINAAMYWTARRLANGTWQFEDGWTMIPSQSLFIERATLTVNGRTLTASLYGTLHRRTGRRIIVHDSETVLFDTEDCYDFGNATNSLERWLAEHQPARST